MACEISRSARELVGNIARSKLDRRSIELRYGFAARCEDGTLPFRELVRKESRLSSFSKRGSSGRAEPEPHIGRQSRFLKGAGLRRSVPNWLSTLQTGQSAVPSAGCGSTTKARSREFGHALPGAYLRSSSLPRQKTATLLSSVARRHRAKAYQLWVKRAVRQFAAWQVV